VQGNDVNVFYIPFCLSRYLLSFFSPLCSERSEWMMLHFPQKEAEIISPDKEVSMRCFKECRRGRSSEATHFKAPLCRPPQGLWVARSQILRYGRSSVFFSTLINLFAPFSFLPLAHRYSTPPVWNLSPPNTKNTSFRIMLLSTVL